MVEFTVVIDIMCGCCAGLGKAAPKFKKARIVSRCDCAFDANKQKAYLTTVDYHIVVDRRQNILAEFFVSNRLAYGHAYSEQDQSSTCSL